MNTPLVLWSGGCDSTAIICDYLDKGIKIRTLAVNSDQVLSVPYEKVARRRLRREFRKLGYTFQHQEVHIKSRMRAFQMDSEGLAQPNVWLSFGVGHLHDNEDLVVGYIRGDDVWHYMAWYRHAFESLKAIMRKDDCNLLFPLEWDDKDTIIAKLKEKKLLEHVWYCELPRSNGRRCGRCASCKRMKHANQGARRYSV